MLIYKYNNKGCIKMLKYVVRNIIKKYKSLNIYIDYDLKMDLNNL